jgi:hypothetical protein
VRKLGCSFLKSKACVGLKKPIRLVAWGAVAPAPGHYRPL